MRLHHCRILLSGSSGLVGFVPLIFHFANFFSFRGNFNAHNSTTLNDFKSPITNACIFHLHIIKTHFTARFPTFLGNFYKFFSEAAVFAFNFHLNGKTYLLNLPWALNIFRHYRCILSLPR